MRKTIPTIAMTAAVLATLTACSSSSSTAPAGTTSSGPVQITVWSGMSGLSDVAAIFNRTHPDIHVTIVNAGTNPETYTKLKAALAAGSGAPDVVGVEYFELPTFEITKHLVDMGKYGANDDKGLYVPWAWNQVSDGSKVYGIPIDSGPMALAYRADLFTKYNIPVPTTWDQYAADAALVKKADPTAFIADFGKNFAPFVTGLAEQAGSVPFTYSAGNLPNIGLNVNDAAGQKVLGYWGDLISKKYVDTTDFFTTDEKANYVGGKYWTAVGASWYIKALETNAPAEAGNWKVVPLPQWTSGQNVASDIGGTSLAVTDQTKHPKEATEVARALFGSSTEAWKLGTGTMQLFPAVTSIASDPSFSNAPDAYFGAPVNATFVAASNGVKPFSWTPFQNYSDDTLAANLAKAATGAITFPEALNQTQDADVAFAKKQGFTVK